MNTLYNGTDEKHGINYLIDLKHVRYIGANAKSLQIILFLSSKDDYITLNFVNKESFDNDWNKLTVLFKNEPPTQPVNNPVLI